MYNRYANNKGTIYLANDSMHVSFVLGYFKMAA